MRGSHLPYWTDVRGCPFVRPGEGGSGERRAASSLLSFIRVRGNRSSIHPGQPALTPPIWRSLMMLSRRRMWLGKSWALFMSRIILEMSVLRALPPHLLFLRKNIASSRSCTLQALIYALGIGCVGGKELRYTYEGHRDFCVFPTLPLALPFKGSSSDVVPFPGPCLLALPTALAGRVNPVRLRHTYQQMTCYRELDPRGASLMAKTTVTSAASKRSGALFYSKTVFWDERGIVCETRIGLMILGLKVLQPAILQSPAAEKDDARPAEAPMTGHSSPDYVSRLHVASAQALLYR
jgi:hypothetical protein